MNTSLQYKVYRSWLSNSWTNPLNPAALVKFEIEQFSHFQTIFNVFQ